MEEVCATSLCSNPFACLHESFLHSFYPQEVGRVILMEPELDGSREVTVWVQSGSSPNLSLLVEENGKVIW